ncbi:hypothetical protein CWE09_09315 [Aliidiomarina minuta]|uniref:Lipoprotein n=1 Tax=Aliidiomarina minuta TaxID=880057 RepID=A0A432WBA2_9GAMM|nr:hypothetical protein [Aliidiomarina minuta]RUO26868.1 hypothetical protein CWE09_09315 [Aliidiomarina minuta]
MKIAFLLIAMCFTLSACSSTFSEPESQAGYSFHMMRSYGNTIQTFSVYGFGEKQFHLNYDLPIARVINDGLDIEIYTDRLSSECLLEEGIDLTYALPKAFPNIENFFSGHLVRLIFTLKENFRLEKSGSRHAPIYLVVQLDNCQGLESNTQAVLKAVEIVYHELYHLEVQLKRLVIDPDIEEENATIFGVCALLMSDVVDRVTIPYPDKDNLTIEDAQLRNNLLIRASSYRKIRSHFNGAHIDTSDSFYKSKIKTLCEDPSL